MTSTVSFADGERIYHLTYGLGTVKLSDAPEKATFMVDFDRPDVVPKYICFDGLVVSDLKRLPLF